MSVRRGGDDDRGPTDPYLNTKHAFYTTSFGDQAAADNDFDEVQIDGNRMSLARQTFDLDDHELVEIHGFKVDWGDPAEGTGKADVHVFNGQHDGQFWREYYEGSRVDDILFHSTTDIDGGTPANETTSDTIWFPKPVLNSGLISWAFREGLNDVGEAAGRTYYTVREFDPNTVLNERIDQMM
jgi:hypothetical protein